METLNLRDVVTFRNRDLLGDGNRSLLASLGGVSLAAGRGLYFSLDDHRLRMVFGLGRVRESMRLGVVLHMKFFLGIVVEWLRFVKLNNVLDGSVVQCRARTGMVERMVG